MTFDVGIAAFGLDKVNEIRKKHNKAPLLPHPLLDKAAINHAIWMAEKDKLRHADTEEILREVGFEPRATAENIAWNQRTEEAVLQTWMNSSGHRANMLGNYKYAAFACAEKYNGIYWIQIFAN